jgi:hypothetical protein
MDKLSLYEILSFVIPGFILLQIIELYNEKVFDNAPLLESDSKISESIMLFGISLFAGILIHIATFRLLKTQKLKWYKKLLFKTPQEICQKNNFIKPVIPFLNSEYASLRKHQVVAGKENELDENLFDFAYLYLEINDKITPSKNFQSLYFWFRNLFTICLLLFPVSIFIYIYSHIRQFFSEQINYAFWIIVANITIALIIIPASNWLREKLIEKVLWSYYVERVHEKQKKTLT